MEQKKSLDKEGASKQKEKSVKVLWDKSCSVPKISNCSVSFSRKTVFKRIPYQKRNKKHKENKKYEK